MNLGVNSIIDAQILHKKRRITETTLQVVHSSESIGTDSALDDDHGGAKQPCRSRKHVEDWRNISGQLSPHTLDASRVGWAHGLSKTAMVKKISTALPIRPVCAVPRKKICAQSAIKTSSQRWVHQTVRVQLPSSFGRTGHVHSPDPESRTQESSIAGA